jgi:hypothetical protein
LNKIVKEVSKIRTVKKVIKKLRDEDDDPDYQSQPTTKHRKKYIKRKITESSEELKEDVQIVTKQ